MYIFFLFEAHYEYGNLHKNIFIFKDIFWRETAQNFFSFLPKRAITAQVMLFAWPRVNIKWLLICSFALPMHESHGLHTRFYRSILGLGRLIELSLKSALLMLSIFDQEIGLKQVIVNREKQAMFFNVSPVLRHFVNVNSLEVIYKQF